MNDDLGDRMKEYEMAEAGRKAMRRLPIMVRLDGKGFSKFTAGLTRPYDKRLSDLMVDTTKYLVEESGAVCGYTQSDEISLVLWADSVKSQIYFDGRLQKLTRVLAARASVFFCSLIEFRLPEKSGQTPVFDCRAWNVPDKTEATNTLLWRELDATKNSISMAAREYYSHSELFEKTGDVMQEMLFQKGVNWNDYPSFFKRGTYVLRRKAVRAFTAAEIEKLPEKHAARANPELTIKRTVIESVELPPLNKVWNREEVVFYGHAPESLQPMNAKPEEVWLRYT